MNWIEQIKNYRPTSVEEKKDRELILNYIEKHDDLLVRDNLLMHFTSSALVLNETRDATLMVFHNQFQAWSWPGGHVDADPDFLSVALREVREETGAKNLRPIFERIASLRMLAIEGHWKKGAYVPAHLHLSVGYLVEGSSKDELRHKEDENKAVRWIPLSELDRLCHEEHMKVVYRHMLQKLDL